MLYTIIQIIAFQALFLLVYDLFLKRETFFNYNRVYLLSTSLLAMVLPFLKFPKLKTLTIENVVIQLPEVFIGTKIPSEYEILVAEQAGLVIERPEIPLWQTFALIGMSVATLIFLFKIVKLYRIKQKNPKRWQGNVLLVKLIKSTAAFSFFNTIFLGEEIPETEKLTIYKHELVHIKERHTLDLLYFEVFRILFWFNPLIYMYQSRIKELHEYVADAKAVKQNGKADYYQSLLKQVFDVNNVSFTNTFFKKSLIKKRIAMLQKSKSRRKHLIKYALLIPLIFGMLIYTSAEVRAQEKVYKKEILEQEVTDEELKAQLLKELLNMKESGASFSEIFEFVMPDRLKYISSRKEYLRFMVYSEYLSIQGLERKSEKGTLTQNDIDKAEAMNSHFDKTYKEYREWKQTDEAKELWELSTQDGILKVVVKELGNNTAEEQKRFDDLSIQLENDDFFTKLVICEVDSASRFIIDSPNHPRSDKEEIVEVVETVEVPFSVIEEVPTLPECKDLATNAERKKCMSDFIQKHVAKEFNKGVSDSIGVNGRQRIFVSFKINKEGDVVQVNARASHLALEDEAKRVMNTLPKFSPGRQKGKLVVVPYSLPIVFQVTDTTLAQEVKSYNELVAQRDRILKNSSAKNPVVIKLNHQIDSLKEARKEVLTKYLRDRINETKKDTINDDEITFSTVDIAPIHPDCNTIKLNDERKKCTSNAVQKLIHKNFNTKLANSLELGSGKQRIFIYFSIDATGKVVDVAARAPHPKLEEEAIRVINLLPKFKPGQNEGKAVNVDFSLPIVFQSNNSKKN